MSYVSPYNEFIFEDYSYNHDTQTASFHYSFDGKQHFTESVIFSDSEVMFANDSRKLAVLESALQLSFYVVGTSYYKCFPTKKIVFKKTPPTAKQAAFLQQVYTKGLSQFIFENNLSVDDIAIFNSDDSAQYSSSAYDGKGLLALQSGGKDSLLLATLLEEENTLYSAMYISSSKFYPGLLNDLASPVRVTQRVIDQTGLSQALQNGGITGHVPITYIVESFALIDAILHNEKSILVSIGNEGNEPHTYSGELPVNHQWSKSWEAEQLLAEYVADFISPDIQIGSPLRAYSELKIAELFTQHAWNRFGHSFSSCNQANYKQGSDNTTLTWCGDCPKCANSYLLFAPFVEPQELQDLFGGQNLFTKPSLTQTFKGLLGIDGIMKPLECVGEVDELRLAYHMALDRKDVHLGVLPFSVPLSNVDYNKLNQSQAWVQEIITTV